MIYVSDTRVGMAEGFLVLLSNVENSYEMNSRSEISVLLTYKNLLMIYVIIFD